MSRVLSKMPRFVRRACEVVGSYVQGGAACRACGFAGKRVHRSAIWPGLVSEWELDPEWARWMDQREGTRCAWCGANLRSDQMAQAILAVLREQCSVSAKCLAEAFALPQVQRLAIAEINSAGNLHPHLARCPGLRYSEYGGNRPSVPSENLLALSYSDAQFDLVLTSDTLEHVPDVDQALRETLRVLKPGGAHVISVPIVWPRATRQRAALRDGVLEHILPPSYHGVPAQGKHDFLVFYEFGADFLDRCTAAGFVVEVLREDANPALVTIVGRKPR